MTEDRLFDPDDFTRREVNARLRNMHRVIGTGCFHTEGGQL